MDRDPAADQGGGDLGLKVRECQDEIGFKGADLIDVRRGEGADMRLLATGLGRAHDVARDPDNAVLLAEQVKGLDGLFGKADDAPWRKHAILVSPHGGKPGDYSPCQGRPPALGRRASRPPIHARERKARDKARQVAPDTGCQLPWRFYPRAIFRLA